MKTLLISAIFATTAFTSLAQADNDLSSLIYEQSSNIFASKSFQPSTQDPVRSYGDNYMESVWSAEFEEYVNPTDFKLGTVASISDINQQMDKHPTAAGSSLGHEVFVYNALAGEYHLQ